MRKTRKNKEEGMGEEIKRRKGKWKERREKERMRREIEKKERRGEVERGRIWMKAFSFWDEFRTIKSSLSLGKLLGEGERERETGRRRKLERKWEK